MKTLLTAQEINDMISTLAARIVASIKDLDEVALIGIQPRGIYFAKQIFDIVQQTISTPGPLLHYGNIDITLYRDDLYQHITVPKNTDIHFDLHQKKIILFDDVLFTGRTIRAALEALNDFGRPSQVWLCVLIDRSASRQLPIQANFVGKTLNMSFEDKVIVHMLNNPDAYYVEVTENKQEHGNI